MENLLFEPFTLGSLTLANRIVMAPMTRSRATAQHVPTPIMAEYYAQRASVGLIITEGVAPAANGAGYSRIPGLYTQEQVEAWKPVTTAVHAAGGRIFAQLMHTGRIGHHLNQDADTEILGPSAIAAGGQMYTDQEGMKPHPTPRAVETHEVQTLIGYFVDASKKAIEAGFDGVEIHGANGYLVEQFIRPSSNKRDDQYGGSPENWARFALEVTEAVATAIGKGKVGIRLSPWGENGDLPYSPEYDVIYSHLATGLSDLGIAYVHLVDHSSAGGKAIDPAIVADIRARFTGTLILNGGYDRARAEEALASGQADLIAIGRPLMANPDYVARIKQNAPLAPVDFSTAFLPGPKGYTDYPVLVEVQA